MTLQDYEKQFIQRKQKKLFWQIVRGMTGRGYKKLNDIPDIDKQEIIAFLKEQYEKT